MYVREWINTKNAIFGGYGLAVFFFLVPGHENIGAIFLFVSLLLAVIIGRSEPAKARFAYAVSAFLLAFFWLLPLGNGGVMAHFFISAGVFIAGLGIFRCALNFQLAFLLVFFLPWMAHVSIGALQIARHILTFEAYDIQHLLATSKLSLSIGVKYYSTILSFAIASSLVLFGVTKNVFFKYLLVLNLLLLALIDNRVALLSTMLSVLVYQLKFRPKNEAIAGGGYVFRAFMGGAIFLMCIVYYPRLALGYDSAIAAINFQDYESWKYHDLFVKEFCSNDTHTCTVDQSVFFRLSWIFWGLHVIYENPMGIGLAPSESLGVLGGALALYGLNARPEIQDFHNELMNVAVMMGVPGALGSLAVFGMTFLAANKKAGEGVVSGGLALAYILCILLFLRFVTESVGGLGMYLFSVLIFSFVVTEAKRAPRLV